MKCHISIHDVSPKNLDKIIFIINHLNNKHNIKKITLLVIPGLEWNDEQIKIFNEWENNQNIELASHGWIHKSNSIKSIYHYFHSKLISDDCAEHLSLSKSSIIKLMKNSYSWFIDRELTPPTLYVPPAWALGNINKKDLLKVPFNEIETICGVHISNKFIFIPLIGFETKNYFRFIIVKISNSINYLLYHIFGLIRIAIHPNDFNLLLKKDIDKYLDKVTTSFRFNEIKIK